MLAEKKILFKKIAEINLDVNVPLRFGGGEPLLVPYLNELLTYCADNFCPASITTNGILVSEEKAKELAKIKINSITVSIDGTELYNEKIGFLAFDDKCYENLPKCHFVAKMLTIKYDGSVVVCAAVPNVMGNIYTDDINRIYENISVEIDKIQQIPDECVPCTFANVCRGGCKSPSVLKYGHYNCKDDCCYVI